MPVFGLFSKNLFKQDLVYSHVVQCRSAWESSNKALGLILSAGVCGQGQFVICVTAK